MIITLTPEQVRIAEQVGRARQSASSQSKDAHGRGSADGHVDHILGATGEMAFSVVSGLPWSRSVNTFKQPDFVAAGYPAGIEIRTRSLEWYELYVRGDDDPLRAYVLVYSGDLRQCNIRGWVMGQDARRPEWLKSHGGRPPAWFVPHGDLLPMGNLFALIREGL